MSKQQGLSWSLPREGRILARGYVEAAVGEGSRRTGCVEVVWAVVLDRAVSGPPGAGGLGSRRVEVVRMAVQCPG